MSDDYRYGDEWDWDRSDEGQYCAHGTFIGSWWGPDLLCQWCELGISVEEVRAEQRAAAVERARTKQAEYERLRAMLTERIGVRADVATWLVGIVWYQAGDHLLDDLLPDEALA